MRTGIGTIGRAATIIGAAGAVALTVYVGRTNAHVFLTAIFVVWVLAPFALLYAADTIFVRWPPALRTALHAVMILTAAATLTAYVWRAISPPRAQGAFVFVVVPVVSCVLAGVVLGVTALTSRRDNRAT